MLNKFKNYIENNKWLIVFLCFLPFIYKILLPDGSEIYIFEVIKTKAKYLSFLAILTMFIIKKKKPSKLLYCLFVYDLWIVITSLINNIDQIKTTITYVITGLAISMLIELYLDDIEDLLKGLILNFEIFLYLNFVTVILYHSTKGYLTCHYLLGYYNTMLVFAYPAICIAVLYMYKFKNYIRPSILIAVSILTIILAGGSTPLGALLASIGIFIVLLLLNKFNKKIPFWILSLLLLAFNIFIVFFFVGGKYKIIDFIIEKVLKRATNFTGRLTIWESAESMFCNKWLTGYGFKTPIPYAIGSDLMMVHAHDCLLTVAVFTGSIGLIIYLVLHGLLIHKIDNTKDSIIKISLISLIFGIFLSYVTECYQKDFMFFINFFLTYHLDTIITKNINKNINKNNEILNNVFN